MKGDWEKGGGKGGHLPQMPYAGSANGVAMFNAIVYIELLE